MKKTLALILALAAGSASFAADQLPLFNATLSVGKDHRFVLIDSAGKASSFLAIGESFAGYKLKSYDAKTGVLEIEKGGVVSKLTLVGDAAIANAPMPPAKATVADAEAVLNKMHFEEMLERSLVRQKKMIAAQFERVSEQFTRQGADPADAAEFQKKMTEEVLSVLDGKALKSEVARIYSDVFTRQELDQIAAFYSTPLGEMLNSKQPEVQDRLGAVIQGKMGEVMPRVQQMGRDFAMNLRAKQQAGGAAPTDPATPPATPPAPKQ